IRPVRLSENYATLFNKPIEDMIGKSMYNVYPKEIADKIIAEDMDVINNKKSIETEEKVYDRIYTSIKFPIQIDDKATFIAGFSIDITDKRKAEEALRDMEKLESVGTLAGGIAHDFNNLLMGLFGNITLAKHQLSEDHPAVASLEQAEKVMDRATGLSKQLLTFAKGGEPVKETVDISKLIEETVNFDLSGSNVKAHFDIPTELEYAEVDKGQIQQVLSNLVINAKQAMLYGGNLHIQLSNKVLKNGKISNLMTGKYIKISIRDDGKGIDKKDIERIFDPYFSTKKTGSGLGLATCHSIVSKHGGHILVESEMGKGSCFIIYLPASKEKTIKTELQEEETIIPNNSVAKILVMDDDEMILNIVTRSLQIDGYRIETALHGQMAIDMYRDAMEKGEGFDLLILDLTIPGGIGGKETLKEILKIDPNAKAIVSSGYATDPVMANFKDFGFKAVAEKPYRISKFRAIVNKVLVSSV
ncbi:MAG: response regulator, partial [Candidatus Marinimicrobia bacterium]|nr:response regulator [Candidatus Neomarinimicrobiota bacterium]